MAWNVASSPSEFSIDVMFSKLWLMKCCRAPSRSEILCAEIAIHRKRSTTRPVDGDASRRRDVALTPSRRTREIARSLLRGDRGSETAQKKKPPTTSSDETRVASTA